MAYCDRRIITIGELVNVSIEKKEKMTEENNKHEGRREQNRETGITLNRAIGE